MGELRLTSLHLIPLSCRCLRLRVVARHLRGPPHHNFLHLFLKLHVDGLLVLHFLLVHFDFLCLDGELLAHSICVLQADLTHLTLLEEALELSDSLLQLLVFFALDYLLLAHSEQLSFHLVELISECLEFSLLLFVCSDE